MKKNIFQTYRSLNIEVKASMWFMVCSILQKGISFITVPLFTRMLTDAEYGTYSLFLSWESIIAIFATLNLSNQPFNNGMAKYRDDRDGYTVSMVGLSFLLCIFSMGLFFLIRNTASVLLGTIKDYMPLMFANMFFTAASGLWIVRQRYEYKYKTLTLMTLLSMLLNPVLGIVFVTFCKDKANGRIYGTVVSSALLFLFSMILLTKKSKRFACLKYWKYALKLSLPLIPHYLSMVVLSSSDRVMIGKYCGEAYTAYYSVASNAAMIMQIVLTSINSSLNPWIYQQLRARNFTKIKKVSSPLLLVVASVNLLPMLFAPEIISILGSSGYMQAVSIMPALSCSVFVTFLYSLFVNVELYYEKNKLTSLGSAGAAIANILLNLIFIPKFGYEAAAYTTLLCYILLAIFHYAVVKYTCKKEGITENIYNTRLFLVLTTILFAASFIIRMLYKHSLVRYAIILGMAIVLFVLRKKISYLLQSLKK